jgi:glycosyltransferase involved in cell wall biosynthesis
MSETGSFLVLIPVFDDWAACRLLLAELDETLSKETEVFELLVVDDGSLEEGTGLDALEWRAFSAVRVLRLRRNLGHQRAIAVALAYAEASLRFEAVVVMDGDGEDRPRDVPRLVRAYRDGHGERIVFAARTRRSESALFRLSYGLFRAAHRVLTGIPVRVGNFSVIPAKLLRRLVVVSELWSHYAAAVFVSRAPYATIPTERGRRLAGGSKMNVVALVIHGLSAISVFSEIVGVRLLLASLGLIGLGAVLFVLGLIAKLSGGVAVPEWAGPTLGVAVAVMAQAVVVFFLVAFMTLRNRQNLSFLPVRDYAYFVEGVTMLRPA